jgi:alkanesulfonate monooxygenase SsuD/methylene tetrahydromethanopterin reductase-like flavin-dependent oxidoreductase (luciferase family)
MCQVAGEVADGIRAHPVATPRYIAEIMRPAARKGMAKAGRDGADFTMCVTPLVATAPAHAGLAERIQDVRARVAFYASTPAYLAAFETEGHGEVARQLQGLARAQRWEEMAALVDDEMLDTYAVTGIYDEIAAKLTARYGALATHLEFTMPLASPADADIVRRLVAELKRA